jgi:hypothetical protein
VIFLHLYFSAAKFDRNTSAPKDISSSCRSCGFVFTLFKRKQICNFCKLGHCDLCTKKKVEVNDDQLKCCDGCYNKMTRLCELENQRLFMLGKLNDVPMIDHIRSKSADLANKKDLLRGAQEKTDQPATLTETIMKTSGMSVLMRYLILVFCLYIPLNTFISSADTYYTFSFEISSLGEAKEQLHARGEKLDQLSDKTSKLASSADKFAELAKQLNKEKSSWW